MFRIFATVAGVFLLGLAVNGQTQNETDYVKNQNRWSNAAGLRFGGTSGVSVKHRFSERNIVELIGGRTDYSYGLTALYEHYLPTTAEGLSVYFGGGGHIAKPFKRNFLVTDDGTPLLPAYSSGNTILGIDGVFGLEYLLNKIPMSVNAEFKPYAEFFRWTGSSQIRLDPGVGLRYHF